jgi:hypothetical protein
MWKFITYLYLIAISGFAGAAVGSGVGVAVSQMTGQPDWVLHGRCAGWTAFTLFAAIAAPFGLVHFCRDTGQWRKIPGLPSTMLSFEQKSTAQRSQSTEGGIKAVLMAPFIGGFMGLILAFPLSGILTVLYFFVTLSPLAPGGWWPILPPAFRSIGDGFALVILAVMGACVILGAILTLSFGVSWGKTRFQVFGRQDRLTANHPHNQEPN